MKKSLTLVALLVMVVGLVMPYQVSAMTETELLNKAKQSYTVGNNAVQLRDEVITQIENYLNKYELSSEDCQIIADKMDEAIALGKNSGARSWNELPSSVKTQMIAKVEDITTRTSVKATLTSDGKLTIFNNDGTVFTKVEDAVVLVGSSNGANTSYTGVAATSVVLFGMLALAGFGLVTKKVSKANA